MRSRRVGVGDGQRDRLKPGLQQNPRTFNRTQSNQHYSEITVDEIAAYSSVSTVSMCRSLSWRAVAGAGASFIKSWPR